MKISHILSAAVLTCSVLALASTNISIKAQNDTRGLIVGPAIMELRADRGGSYDYTVNLENANTTESLSLTPFVQGFSADENGSPIITELADDAELKQWISFQKPQITLAPSETTDAKFLVRIPESAQPGSYYAAISFVSQEEETVGTTQVEINKEVSALLFITVNGKVERDVVIEKLEVENTVIDPFFDILNIDYSIKADGNAYYKPTGNILFGDTANPDATLPLNENERFILPSFVRSFTYAAVPSNSFFTETSNDDSSVDFNSGMIETPLFGSQEVAVNAIYVNSEGEITTKIATTDVLYLPWKSGLILLLIIGIVGGAGYFGYKKYKKTK